MGTQDHSPKHRRPRQSAWAPWLWPVLALGVLGIAVPLAVEHVVPLQQAAHPAATAATAASPARSALVAQATPPRSPPDQAARCAAIARELLRVDAAPGTQEERSQHARDLHKARVLLDCGF